MAERINQNGFAAEFFAANSTVNNAIVRAAVYAIGNYVVFNNSVTLGVAECINQNGIAAEFVAANGTVNNAIIRAAVYAVGSHVVFNNSVTLFVAKCGKLHRFKHVLAAASTLNIHRCTGSIAGSIYLHVHLVIVLKSGNDNVLTAGFSTAERTVSNVIIGAVSGTGGSDVVFHNDLTGRMAGHRNHNRRASGFYTANGTVGNFIIGTLGDAICLNDVFPNRLTVGVSKRINDVANDFICTALGAAVGRVTLSHASRLCYNAVLCVNIMDDQIHIVSSERNFYKAIGCFSTVIRVIVDKLCGNCNLSTEVFFNTEGDFKYITNACVNFIYNQCVFDISIFFIYLNLTAHQGILGMTHVFQRVGIKIHGERQERYSCIFVGANLNRNLLSRFYDHGRSRNGSGGLSRHPHLKGFFGVRRHDCKSHGGNDQSSGNQKHKQFFKLHSL